MPDIPKNARMLDPGLCSKGLQQADRRGHGNARSMKRTATSMMALQGEDIELPGALEVNMAVFLAFSFSYDLR